MTCAPHDLLDSPVVSPVATRYTGQRLLVALILWYRRRMSGRGPLWRVCCTFAHTESCSTYGLRIARREATSRDSG